MRILRRSALVLLCFLAATVSATPSTPAYTLDPAGPFIQGSNVTVSFSLNYAERFAYTRDLQFSTNLDNPRWNYTIFLNSVPEPRPVETKRNVSISGFELDYPTRNVFVAGTLGGTLPLAAETTPTVFLAADEFDTRNNVIVASPLRVVRDDLPNASSPPNPESATGAGRGAMSWTGSPG